MSLLDDAVAAFLAPSSGHSDPLTAATLDQCTQPAALDAPLVREGWEDEPIAPPHPWVFYAACAVCGFFLFLLVGCGGGGDEPPCDDTPPNSQPVDCKARPELCV